MNISVGMDHAGLCTGLQSYLTFRVAAAGTVCTVSRGWLQDLRYYFLREAQKLREDQNSLCSTNSFASSVKILKIISSTLCSLVNFHSIELQWPSRMFTNRCPFNFTEGFLLFTFFSLLIPPLSYCSQDTWWLVRLLCRFMMEVPLMQSSLETLTCTVEL